MATKSKTAAPADPAPEPTGDVADAIDTGDNTGDPVVQSQGVPQAAPTHPPITEYQSAWVYKTGVALAGNQVGFVTVLKTAAATMIAAGDAVDPNLTMDLPEIGGASAPPPAPPRTAYTVTFTSFDAASPAVGHYSAEDGAKVKNGDALALVQTAGDPPSTPMSFGYVSSPTATSCTLSGVSFASSLETEGVTATGTFTPG